MINWHHKAIAQKLTDFILDPHKKKLMLFVPPQHGKSELASRCLPAFALGVNPDLKIVGTSYSIDLARSFNRDIQRIIDSEEYRQVFPNTQINTKNVVTVQSYLRNSEMFEVINHKGSYKCVGVMGGLSGFPVDIAIIDDPVKDALEAYSQTYRDRVWEWYLNVLLTRLHNKSKQIIIMTRWHQDDLCGRILEQEPNEWELVVYPAILDEKTDGDPRNIGEALWAERHSLEKLLKTKQMSERVFNSLYQQRPTSIEGAILKKQWFGRFDMEEIAGCPVNFMVDTAYTSNSANDANAILAYVIKDNIGHILNMTVKRLEFPELCRQLQNDYNMYGSNRSIVYIEPKASGKSVVQQLKKTTGLNVTEAPSPTTDKESRAYAISSVIESGRIKLLNGASWVDNLLEECAAFPNAKNDDQVDTVIMLCEKMGKQSHLSLR